MQTVQQAIDGGQGVGFSDLGQVGIAGRGGGAGMAEQILDVTQAQAAFEQVGGKAMAQGVCGDFFLKPH